ncbi:hypothetical protein VP01_8849g1 [Puccinia sorghi]|uniref:Tet-like 2OG-Fe(II) oxygenase domain-containing protein n=1 Tax=Puccinia sorghi TaxID=27349 RepID=A0A0L6UAF6_9BASI|nr:hypothetical protein VP01_8849g1 [Puccinia sorghi]
MTSVVINLGRKHQWFYLVSGPLFDEVKKQHNALKAPGLEPKFQEDPDDFTFHLSFTISNFAKKNPQRQWCLTLHTCHMDPNQTEPVKLFEENFEYSIFRIQWHRGVCLESHCIFSHNSSFQYSF